MEACPPHEAWFADAVPVRAAMIDAYLYYLDDVERVLAFRVLRETRGIGLTAAALPIEQLAKRWEGIGRTVDLEELREAIARLIAKRVIFEVHCPDGAEWSEGPCYCTNDAWPEARADPE